MERKNSTTKTTLNTTDIDEDPKYNVNVSGVDSNDQMETNYAVRT